VHFFNYAKGELAALEKAKLRTEATKKLAETRNERMQRIVREREEAARQRAAKKAAADLAKVAAKKAAAEAVKLAAENDKELA
jgi:electron transport complex protein RnfC